MDEVMFLVGHIYECWNNKAKLWELRYYSHHNIHSEPIFVMYKDDIKKQGYGGIFTEYKYIGASRI